MAKKPKETAFVMPKTLEELEAVLAEQTKQRQKLDLEKRLGKLKKSSDLIETKRRIARIETKIREIKK